MMTFARGSSDPNDDAIGMFEVIIGGPLAQELGVGSHGEVGVGLPRPDRFLDFVAGSHGNGRLVTTTVNSLIAAAISSAAA